MVNYVLGLRCKLCLRIAFLLVFLRLSFYELRVVAMRVARPFKNIQLILFNSLRAVLGMGMKMVLHAMDLINPVLAVVSGKSKNKYKS
jgi:hypothetical protein